MPKPAIWLTAALAATSGAALAQTPIPPSARDFANMAAQSDTYEIEAARTAAAQSRDDGVRAFAQQMILDHTRTRDAVKRAAAASGLPPPPDAMSADQSKMLGSLQSQRGPDFDRAYARQQVMAHQQALAVERSFAEAGADPNLRTAAQSAVPMIQHHLQMAQQLKARFGGP